MSANSKEMIQKLGMGYSSDSKEGTGTFCIEMGGGNIVEGGKPTASLKFSSVGNAKELNDVLDVGGSLSVDKGAFSLTLSGRYAKSSEDLGYSVTSHFFYELDMPTEMLILNQFGEAALNNFGKSALAANTFTEACGDMFIIQERLGAKLIGSTEISFKSKQDKEQIEASFTGELKGIGKASGSINIEKLDRNLDTSIKLTAMQIGGDVTKLSKVLGEGETNPILSCTLANDEGTKKCKETNENILNYGKGYGADGFTDQINGNSYGVVASLGYAYKSYKDIGIAIDGTQSLEQIEEIRKWLGEANRDLKIMKTKISNMTMSGNIKGTINQQGNSKNPGQWEWDPNYLSIKSKMILKRLSSGASDVLAKLNSTDMGAIECYNNSSTCADIKQSIEVIMQHKGLIALPDLNRNNDRLLKKIYAKYHVDKFDDILVMNTICKHKNNKDVEDDVGYNGRHLFLTDYERTCTNNNAGECHSWKEVKKYYEHTTYIVNGEILEFKNEYKITNNGNDNYELSTRKIDDDALVPIFDKCGGQLTFQSEYAELFLFFKYDQTSNTQNDSHCMNIICDTPSAQDIVSLNIPELYSEDSPI